MKLTKNSWLWLVGLLLAGCSQRPSFTFQAGVIDYTLIKTMSMETFYADVAAGPANLGLRFTEDLREYFMRNTRLALVKDNGDLAFSGTINKYEVSPVAPTAGTVSQPGQDGTQFAQLAGQQRLTITVKVNYVNTKDDTQSFEQEFSFFQDFAQGRNLSEVEQELIRTIFDQLILDIFNKTIANW
jgi:hypothetical protein